MNLAALLLSCFCCVALLCKRFFHQQYPARFKRAIPLHINRAFLFQISLGLFFASNINAQQKKYEAFTVTDGLPSNHIYQCVEDDYGFLWVATDAGIARFDGKHFQVFTTQQGLPDNEVLQVVKEKSGRIWVNCFKQSPSYFDEVRNRFITAKEDSNLAKVSGTTNMNLFVLSTGGVMFTNENGGFIFRDRKLCASSSNTILSEKDKTSVITVGLVATDPRINIQAFKFGQFQSGRLIDSLRVVHASANMPSFGIDDEKLYVFFKDLNKCYRYSEIQTNPLRFRVDSFSVPKYAIGFNFLTEYLYIINDSASVYVFNKKTLRLQYVLAGDYLPNNFYIDKKGNKWLCTIDKGLLVSRQEQLATVDMPADYKRGNFISIARKPDGTLLAGNFYGEVIESYRGKFIVHEVTRKKPSRQRKILVLGKEVYSISEDGIFVNYATPVLNMYRQITQAGKTAIVYNDTSILIGSFSSITELNTRSKKITSNARYKRVTTMVKASDLLIYFGSTDGLYKFYYPSRAFVSLTKNHSLLSERIASLCFTSDSLLWVATSGNGIAVVKNDKVLASITTSQGIINNVCRSIATAGPGQVWLGTTTGISIINYTLKNDKINITAKNLSVNDGLPSNEINDMLYYNDTVYAATGNGISIIPVSAQVSRFNIPVRLIKISINQRDTFITSSYKLNYHQQNIQMQFAGIELNGHFKNLQYRLDNSNDWTDLAENTITLQLSDGDHQVEVRAIDVNNNIGTGVLTLHFSIATPFWKSVWFWIMIMVLLQLGGLYFFSRQQKKRKEAKLAKALAGVQTASLEQQAFTSLMNPHFIFNALNSIQHYINVQDRQNANRYLSDFASLIRKNFEASQHSFIALEQEIENLKIYLRLEQMRFTDRFNYYLNVDDSVDIDEWMIPAMMLQPILENAVLHGIMPSTIKGELLINLKELNKSLEITIVDNGIGVSNSLARKQPRDHNSHGMALIKKRIAALSRFASKPILYQMTAAYEDEKNPGTKIVITIPSDLYELWIKAKG